MRLVGEAQAQRRDGRLGRATESARRAVALAPGSPGPRRLLGELYHAGGDCARATAHLVAYTRLGRKDKAVRQADALIRECTSDAKRQGQLRVRVTPSGADVRVDAPGRKKPADRILLPKPGETSALEVALERDPVAAARTSRQRWGLAVTVASAALFAGGMVALVQGLDGAREAEAAFARYARADTTTTLGSAWDDSATQGERAELRTAVGIGLLTTAAITAVLGTRWWLTEPRP